jgi:Domain of unknown function (DUF4157)
MPNAFHKNHFRQTPGLEQSARKAGGLQPFFGSGNSFFSNPPIQAKLTVNEPGDRYEQEADSVADKVVQKMQGPVSAGSENNNSNQSAFQHGISYLQRKCAACSGENEELQKKELPDKEDEKLQRKETGNTPFAAPPPIESQLNTNKGSGSAIAQPVQQTMGNAIGADFSNVKIHTDSNAVQMSKELNAQAFTHGNDIYFNEGKYNPESKDGQHLLAHELTHTIQQNANPKVIRRQVVNQRSGNTVGVGRSNNIREEVLNTMDRLHELWSITTTNYAIEYPSVGAFAPGASIPAASIPLTIDAIRLNEQPHIHPAVARNFLAINLSATVGRGMVNNKNDVSLIQTILRAHGLLPEPDFISENATVTASTLPVISESLFPQTMLALSQLKQQIAGGRTGWPPIHADERRYGPTDDRFGARTFQFGHFSIFIPSGAATTQVNNVHVFFSPGGVQGESGLNAVLHHGLRGASDSSSWILIGVPGAEPGFVTISTSEINSCLNFIGRGAHIDGLRLSAHSRGYRGLRETVRRRLVNTAIISRVVIFDANYEGVANVLARSGIPPGIVTAYNVGSGRLPLSGSTTHSLNANCMRAIGYTRLIRDAMITQPRLIVPPAIRSQLLNLPPRGSFSTQARPPSPLVSINDFCNTNRSAINTMIGNENDNATGLKTFFDNNNLGRFVDPVTGEQYVFTPGIYSHHFFVTELAHEVTD